MAVQIKKGKHPLTGRPSFSLWRVADGKLEASGFTSLAEAKQYAASQGLTITK